jgi:subtilisin family serine protease
LAAADVRVINVSLVGPANAALERVVSRLVASDRLLVAAVGNDGPAAAPLYPAAYPGVVGVTAVDVKRRVLPEACRGPHVAFAAPGADMAAAAERTFAAVRGTSFAAPIVAGLLAREWREGSDTPDELLARLSRAATDLGRGGRDDIYGAGLVGERYRSAPGRFAARQ